VEAWQSLVHVCRRWRSVALGSPRRLNLRLLCKPGTRVRDKLDVWPPLLLVIWGSTCLTNPDGDDLTTLLERRDRVCQINLCDAQLPLEKLIAAMQRPFPELTDLVLSSFTTTETVLPDSFLGGSAPRLRELQLFGIPFPGLPKLLLSAIHLVRIQLYDITQSGYFSPEALVTALSTLSSLKLLVLKFQFRSSSDLPSASRRPPTTRSLFPALLTLSFDGFAGYLDDLVARVDTPRLKNLEITFFDQDELDVPQVTQFIRRTPMLEALEKACVAFWFERAAVKLSLQTSGRGELEVKIMCRKLNRQVSTLKRLCTSYLPLSTSEDVYISGDIDPQADLENDVANILWLDLLHLITGVKNLYLSEEIVPLIWPALRGLVGGSTTEVLPIVQNIFLGEIQPRRPGLDGVEEFIAARRLSGRPITVSTIPFGEET
jgi:hypothetical protein